MSSIEKARKVLKAEARALSGLSRKLGREFNQAVKLIYKCSGRVVVTGLGKSGIIGQKIAATFSSTGTPSLWLHPADGLHGDIGSVQPEDCVIALSYSGETEELIRLLPILKKIGTKIIAITSKKRSKLARYADCVLDINVKQEACPFNLAPTTSTTAMLALGDALAVALIDKKAFKKKDFAFYHPAGTLGKSLLLTVDDIMRTGEANPVVKLSASVKDVLLTITRARAGSASVVDKKSKLIGIFTDGDLRRHLDDGKNIASRPVKEIMTKSPVTVKSGHLATEALAIMRKKKIDEIPVVDKNGKPVGLIDVQDLLRAGLV